MRASRTADVRAERIRGARAGSVEPPAEARPLFDALRAWRKTEAAAQSVPPYVIFIDRTLLDIAIRRPGDLEALRQCDGVGQGKLDRYGDAVLRIVRTS